ncbi:MAG: membrane integrity-associated transporter subunit PqiC [Victivallales bacterium]|nr:membrane integrity-associated transporter subunit PqiC [Victivallales bacterium]
MSNPTTPRFFKIHIVFPVAASLALAFATGCGVLSTEPYQEAFVYDLGVPSTINKSKIPLKIGRFKTEGPYKSRMVLRRPGNRLDFNDYKKWACSPELMLSRYLALALETPSVPLGKKQAPSFNVSGSILVFETEQSGKTVTLIADYDIRDSSTRTLVKSGRASFRSKIESISSDSISKAMSANAAKLADLILSETAKAEAGK